MSSLERFSNHTVSIVTAFCLHCCVTAQIHCYTDLSRYYGILVCHNIISIIFHWCKTVSFLLHCMVAWVQGHTVNQTIMDDSDSCQTTPKVAFSCSHLLLILFQYTSLRYRSQGCSVTTVSQTGWPGFDPRGGRGFFFSSLCPDQLWDPPSLLFSRYHRSFPRGKVQPLNPIHLVPKSRMSMSCISSLP
jgi:hypothetical protein